MVNVVLCWITYSIFCFSDAKCQILQNRTFFHLSLEFLSKWRERKLFIRLLCGCCSNGEEKRYFGNESEHQFIFARYIWNKRQSGNKSCFKQQVKSGDVHFIFNWQEYFLHDRIITFQRWKQMASKLSIFTYSFFINLFSSSLSTQLSFSVWWSRMFYFCFTTFYSFH